MRLTRDHARGVARSIGLLPGRIDLPDDAVIVSPHLDDAVFSLGAAIAKATRRGSTVTVLTVLAGDPESTAPAGPWDSRAGFKTARDAARTRRAEDARACELVGATTAWLPFSDHQYERGGTDAQIRTEVVDAVAQRNVLLPGFPLRHEDHHWLHALLVDAFDPAQVSLYAEQPYAAAHSDRPGVSSEPTARDAPGRSSWRFLRAGPRDRIRKIAACRAYSSQLPLLDSALILQISKFELRVGGEAIVPAPVS